MKKLKHHHCMNWIEQVLKNKGWVDLRGINELITVYNSIGGSQHFLDVLPPHKQLTEMWRQCRMYYAENEF